jgi:CRISPR-associated protein Csm1
LIAPNTETVKEKLHVAVQTLEKKVFDTFGTTLFVAIEAVPVSKDELMHKDKAQNLGTIWHTLFEKREQKKSCKFADLIENGYGNFFEPIMRGGNTSRDRITGEEFLPNEVEIPFEDTYKIRQNTYNQIELGKRLRETEYMIVSESVLAHWNDQFHINPADLGFYYYFVQKDMTQPVDRASIIRLNDPDFINQKFGNDNTYEFQYYGGNEYAGRSLEEMEKNENFSRLGVLRMDVDNLGVIFKEGISNERASLSRFAALSRSFESFFSGYLNTIWKETDPKLDQSFIIYSGGDDVFMVGRWDKIIQLAKNTRNAFREFTCYNPAFSISGGIAIIPATFPIMKGAEESAEEEKAAKNHSVKGVSKNSISFMDFPMNWEEEFPIVERLKDELVQIVEKDKEAKSLLSKIMAHAANAKIKAHKITNLKTFWMLTYDLSRIKERAKAERQKMLIDNCIQEVCGNKSRLNGRSIETEYHPLELWAFAARWAELEIRKNK